MDDFRQNSSPWRDDDGACSIGLLVAHALLFTVFSSLDMSAYVMQCSALCPLECGLLLLVYVYILEFGKLVFFFHYFSTTYCILLYIVVFFTLHSRDQQASNKNKHVCCSLCCAARRLGAGMRARSSPLGFDEKISLTFVLEAAEAVLELEAALWLCEAGQGHQALTTTAESDYHHIVAGAGAAAS